MSKRHLSITVDSEVWFYYATKRMNEKINLSALVEQFLRYNMELEKDNRDQQELEEKLEELKNSRKQLQEEEQKLQTHLIRIREENEKASKEQLANTIKKGKSLQNANVLEKLDL